MTLQSLFGFLFRWEHEKTFNLLKTPFLDGRGRALWVCLTEPFSVSQKGKPPVRREPSPGAARPSCAKEVLSGLLAPRHRVERFVLQRSELAELVWVQGCAESLEKLVLSFFLREVKKALLQLFDKFEGSLQ